MKTCTYRQLSALHERHGPREFGKIAQKLIALAFQEAGCKHVVERGVQGVDIDAAWDGEKYATEVKTTRQHSIQIGSKDIDGLASRSQDGYRPLLAVLQLRPLSDWLFVAATNLRSGSLEIDSFGSYRCTTMEQRLRPWFDDILAMHFERTLLGSQSYLDGVLRSAEVQRETARVVGPDSNAARADSRAISKTAGKRA